MGTREQNHSTLNEIVFENRNKNYGAYVIRREYDLSLIKSFLIAVLFFAALIASFQLMPKPKIEIEKTDAPVKLIETTFTIHPPNKPVTKTTAPHPNPAPQAHSNGSPTVVEHETRRDSLKTDENNNPNPAPALTATGTGTEPDPGPAVAAVTAPPATYDMAEVNPEFPGGEKKLMEYLQAHIHYPREAIRREVSGTVLMRFVVGTEGEIKQIEFVNKIGAGCEAEAQRVVESMPRWKPGTMKGKPVQVYFYLPVNYHLQ
jgi:protein TonB